MEEAGYQVDIGQLPREREKIYNLLLILALPTFSALASTVFSPFPLFAEPSALDDFANGVSNGQRLIWKKIRC